MVDLNLNNLNVDSNGRVSFSGLSSGIDFEGVVDSMIAARRIPVDRLETDVSTNQNRIAALQDLRTILNSLQESVSRLYGAVSVGNSGNIFESKEAFASTSRSDGGVASAAANLMGVTVSNSASLSSHTVEILQTAKAHKVASDAFASTTASIAGISGGNRFIINGGQGFESDQQSAATNTLGSSGTLNFTLVNGGSSIGSVAYSATDTINDLATNISNNVTGVTATVVTEGTGVRLQITADDTSVPFAVAEGGAGTVLTDLSIDDQNAISVVSGDSLLDIRDRINNANVGATATIASVSSTQNLLVLTNDATGETMRLADLNGTALQTLGLLDGSAAIKNELQAAQKAQFYADGILDTTNTTYESNAQSASTVQIGSTGTLSFTADAGGGALGTVNYSSTDTLADLAANITTNVTGVTATVVTEGNDVRLEITGSSAFSFTETGAGSAITSLGIDNHRLTIERDTNTVNDLFAGLTLSLFQAEVGTTINIDIERDLNSVKTDIVSMVDSYNDLRIFINTQRTADEELIEAEDEDLNALFGSRVIAEVDTALAGIIGNGVTGVAEAFSALAQVGVDFVNNETVTSPLLANTLEIDETALDEALLNNPEDVRKMFAFDFTSSDSRITMLAFNGDTTYANNGYTLNLQPNSGDNMLQRSEELENAFFTASGLTVSANADTAPDGSATADGLIASAGAGPHTLSNSGNPVSVTAGETYIVSAYAKKGAVDQVRLGLGGAGAPSNAFVDFNLDTGAIDTHGTGADDAVIEDVGNGYYRISVAVTAATTGNAQFELTPKDTTNGVGFTGDGTSVSTYVWGAQMADAAGDTTDITAFSATRATINTDVGTTTDPNGGNTAEALVGSAANDTHFVSNSASISATGGNSYSFTTYVKAGAETAAQVELGGSAFAGANVSALVNLSAGTITSTGSEATATIEDAGSGWYRVTVTGNATTSGSIETNIYGADASTGTTYTGTGAAEDIYFWEPTLVDNENTTPGGYIETTSTALTGVTATGNINGAADGSDDGSVTIANGVITVNTGGAAGLQMLFNGIDIPSNIQLDFTVGVGAQMFFEIEDLLDTSTGLVETEIDTLEDQNELSNERIEEMLFRLEVQRQDLLDRFIRMEAALASADRILQSIQQTTEAWSQSG